MNVSRACRRLLTVIILLAGHPAVEAQDADDSRGVGVRPTLVFGALAEQAPQGNAGMFVGVNQFTRDDGLNELAYAVHDAVELAHLFVNELKLVPPANCYLLLSGEPSSESVKQHLAQLRAAGAKVSGADRSKILLTFLDLRKFATSRENLFVCSFSSHGFNEGRTAYVMPSDGHRELLSDTAVPLETIETKMEDSKAGHRLLLVDACQERVSARSSSSAGRAAEAAFIDALRKPSGQAKLASCSPGEFSFEHGSLGGVGHGVFTHSFLEALRGGAKPDDENLVRLGAVSDYVAASVSSWTKELGRTRQTPFLESPVEAKALPLATKADDLATLIAGVRRLPLTGGLTDAFRTRLADALTRTSASQAADRDFVATTRDFSNGRMRAAVFIPYATREIERLLPAALAAGDTRDDNELKMKFVWCPPGTTQLEWAMRSHSLSLPGCSRDDGPSLKIPAYRIAALKDGFWIGQYKVSRKEYHDLMQRRKPAPSEELHPAELSYRDANQFCELLTRREQQAGRLARNEAYRLPTFAEWRYALYAGMTTQYFWGDSIDDSDRYVHREFGEPHPVGSLRPNAWGLYDMIGNSNGQWCICFLPRESFPTGNNPRVNSGDAFIGPISCGSERNARDGTFRVIVGMPDGRSMNNDANSTALAGRYIKGGTEDCPYYTFRIVRSIP